jgi:hypothetical protein
VLSILKSERVRARARDIGWEREEGILDGARRRDINWEQEEGILDGSEKKGAGREEEYAEPERKGVRVRS